VKPLVRAVTQRRVNGIAALIISVVLAIVSIRGGGFRDPGFLIPAAIALAVGTFLQRRPSLLAGVVAANPSVTTLRRTTFDLVSRATRVSSVVLVVAGVTSARTRSRRASSRRRCTPRSTTRPSAACSRSAGWAS
jgi:hypothetical protein